MLVAQGSVAAAWFPGKAPPIDALIVGSIDVARMAGPSRPAKGASSDEPGRTRPGSQLKGA